jgi:hypothetical protein
MRAGITESKQGIYNLKKGYLFKAMRKGDNTSNLGPEARRTGINNKVCLSKIESSLIKQKSLINQFSIFKLKLETMKKVFLMSAAIAAMVFTSCSKEDNTGTGKADTQLSIKISGVIQTRTVEAQGSTAVGTITLTGGHIFVLNPLGVVTYNETLNVSQATSVTGQVVGSPVAADSRVYVIGNIPTADVTTIAALGNWAAIQAAVSAISTQSNYKGAALANSSGLPLAITPGAGSTATVNVSIKPLISRLELTQVKGASTIKAFTVSGVYIDGYYPSFTYEGGHSGTLFAQGQSTNFTGTTGDAGTWAAAGSPLIAAPASSNVWAHNVASGGIPRFIIALTGVKYDKGAGEVDLSGTTHYLTVTGYTDGGTPLSAFERGKIYRIGGTNGIEFDEEDLGLTPNPVNVTLTLKVTIDEWVLVTPNAVL